MKIILFQIILFLILKMVQKVTFRSVKNFQKIEKNLFVLKNNLKPVE